MSPTPFRFSSHRLRCGWCRAFSALPSDTAGAAAPGRPARPGRRLFGSAVLATGAGLALPAWAREGVDVGPPSRLGKLVPAEQLEAAAAQQYAQLLVEARSKNALVADGQPQAERLQAIAQRIIPFTPEWNPRAPQWTWEVHLLASKEINAFCMPGGKIAFFTGLLEQIRATDDEVAMVMGHEVAHALREHARERAGKSAATNIGIELGAALLGLGSGSRYLAGLGNQLLQLKFSRDDETEADLVGMELAARAGYDPRSGITLWTKMSEATGATKSGGAGSQLAAYTSTHPQGPQRIRTIEANLPKVMPLYERAPTPTRRWAVADDAATGRRVTRPAPPAREQSR